MTPLLFIFLTCGTFDTEQLRRDIESGYFEAGGIELAKATLAIMADHVECVESGVGGVWLTPTDS